MKIFLLVLVSVLAGCSAQLTSCGTVEVLKEFNLIDYTGLWYEIERYPTSFEPNGSCVTALYTLYAGNVSGADPVVVYNRLYNDGNGQYEDITGSARLADETSSDAKLLVTFDVAPFPAPYWVIDSDYTNFSLVASCTPGVGVTTAWKLSRQTTLSPNSTTRIDAAIAKPNNHIDPSKFVSTRQGGDCVYA